MAKSIYSENLITLRCTVCKRKNYYTRKNKKKVERKLEYKRYCKWCRKHTPHKEAKTKG
ncbi:MAG TPA: 50S ribosomal protein L33 [Candidatus Paceibacterota bacterium]